MAYSGPFACHDHQGKARAYVQALLRAGYRYTRDVSRARFILSDLDMAGRRLGLEAVVKQGGRVFMYPHAARPMVQWDGMYEVWSGTTASFVIGPGHIEVMRAYGYPLPLHAVGWPYGELAPFKPKANPKKVLFGPIHPNGNGWLSDLDKSINAAVYQRLVRLHFDGAIKLTVRYLKGLQLCGLWPEGGVQYVRGKADLTVADIEQADVVVGHQTFAYLAIARGVPTVMMAEFEPPRSGNSEDSFVRARSWDAYKELLMFPLDILAVEKRCVYELLQRAAADDEPIREWRRLFIGAPFDEPLFVSTLESYL